METINSYLPELLAFREVARSGGFTPAADALNLSKSQLSKQVGRLEAMLGAQLFLRTTRKIALTEEGRQLLKYADQMVALSREAAETMKGLVKEEKGTLRITAPASLGEWFVPELLTLFQERLPGIRVEIDLSSEKRDLIQDNFDFALRAMNESDPDLIARYLGHLRDVLVASPSFMRKHRSDPSDPENLTQLPCLTHSLQEKWNAWKLRKGSKDLVVNVQGRYACSSYATTRLLCLKGLGIARLPFYLVAEDLEKGRLIHLYPDHSIATHPLYLVYPGKSYNTKRQKIVKELIMDWMKGQKEMFI